MDVEELANRLKDMYEHGKGERRQVAMVHLFGIRYAGEIEVCGASVADIVRRASLRESYGAEVQKGRRLAEYVIVREGSLPEGIGAARSAGAGTPPTASRRSRG